MKLVDSLPRILSRQPSRRRSRIFKLASSVLLFCGAIAFQVSGIPLIAGRGLMWVAGRCRGIAYELDRHE